MDGRGTSELQESQENKEKGRKTTRETATMQENRQKGDAPLFLNKMDRKTKLNAKKKITRAWHVQDKPCNTKENQKDANGRFCGFWDGLDMLSVSPKKTKRHHACGQKRPIKQITKDQ